MTRQREERRKVEYFACVFGQGTLHFMVIWLGPAMAPPSSPAFQVIPLATSFPAPFLEQLMLNCSLLSLEAVYCPHIPPFLNSLHLQLSTHGPCLESLPVKPLSPFPSLFSLYFPGNTRTLLKSCSTSAACRPMNKAGGKHSSTWATFTVLDH